MNDSERLAAEFLRESGYSDICWEPDGNVPPDFLVDRRIAVEVRRLNQHFVSDSDRKEGLEQEEFSLRQRMVKLLPLFGAPVDGQSWFVWFDFARPVAKWKLLKPRICAALQEFKDQLSRTDSRVQLEPRFELGFIRAAQAHESFFLLGGYCDDDAGGWVLSETLTNARLCVAEKAQKIAHIRSKYSEWWLILVDHIGYGLDQPDRNELSKLLSERHGWDKVILLDPSNHRRGFEI